MTYRLKEFHYGNAMPGSLSWDSLISTKNRTGEQMINGKLRADSLYTFDSTSSKSSDLLASPDHIVPKAINATA